MMFRNGVQRQRNDSWPHDGSKEANQRERVKGNRGFTEQRSAQRNQRADRETQQHAPAVEGLEKNHSYKTPSRHHAPEPGYRVCAGRVRIKAVILREKPRKPIRGSLFRTDVGEYAAEVEPDHSASEHAKVCVCSPYLLIFLKQNAREAGRDDYESRGGTDGREDPVNGNPLESGRCHARNCLKDQPVLGRFGKGGYHVGINVRAEKRSRPKDELRKGGVKGEMLFTAGDTKKWVNGHLEHGHSRANGEEGDCSDPVRGMEYEAQCAQHRGQEGSGDDWFFGESLYEKAGRNGEDAVREEKRERQERSGGQADLEAINDIGDD